MSLAEVVIADLETDQRIPHGISLRQGMWCTREGMEPITQGAVDSLDVNRPRIGHVFTCNGADLDGEHRAMLITMRDGVRHAHIGRHPQWRTPHLP
jgi:hypothetical protein